MPFDLDEITTRDSTRRLMSFATQRSIRLIVHSHDGPQWEQLRTAPDSYR